MFKLSEEGLNQVSKELERYETKRSAIIPALYIAQKENGGWVSPEAITHLSEVMQIPESEIEEVFTFYTMFNKRPAGRYHVQVCCNISCAMHGGRELTDAILEHFEVNDGEVSADGKVSVSRVECLGSCGTAPMMQVNDTYYEDLTPDKAIQILRELK